MIKKAIHLGLDPATAVQLVTLNPAGYFGLKDRGAIAPGYSADIAVLDDLESFEVTSVCKDGRIVVDHGALVNFPVDLQKATAIESKALNIAPLSPESLRIPFSGSKARVIELVPGQLITHKSYEDVKSKNGFVTSDIESDVLKLCVVERHHASGRIGLGLVRGFGLNRGAMASSVAHDSHNVIAVGVSDEQYSDRDGDLSNPPGLLSQIFSGYWYKPALSGHWIRSSPLSVWRYVPMKPTLGIAFAE